MKNILKILKKHTLAIISVIILLFIQAWCDLSLPDYTAKIINVGIQQNGIENSVPEVIRKSTLDEVFLFTTDEEKENILNNYTLISKQNLNDDEYQNYLEDYPNLANEDLYVLNDIDDVTKLENDFVTSYLLVTTLTSDDEKTKEQVEKMFPQKPNNVEIMDMLVTLDKEALTNIRTEFSKKFDKIDDSLKNQMVIASLQNEYEAIGVNIEQLQTRYIFNVGFKMLGLAFLAMIISIIVTYLSSRIAALFSRDLRGKVVSKVMDFSHSEYKEFGIASLITRSTNDIQQIQMLLVMLLRIVIYAPIIGLGALSKVSGNSMSWIIGVAILMILSLVIILFGVALPKFKIVQKLIDKLNLVSREILTGLPVIRAFANEKHEEKRFDKANIDLTKTNLFVNRVMSVMMPMMMFIMNGICVLIVWVGADKVDTGSIQVGTLIAFITYTMQIIMAFLMISMVSIMLPRAWVSVKRTNEVLNKEISVKDKETKTLDNVKGKIEFKDVYFRYPDAEEDVLRNISFTVEPGTTTAFIGSTGSGKSTLINLIPRFFDVTGGKILIDGINIKDVSLQHLRSNIGYVPQKGVLFSGTIKSNIGFGNENLTEEQLLKAARISQSLEFIDDKEEKFDTSISQGGTNVSGGQKQRLSIARAIAIDPKIFIFDDSFSALDYKTDAKLRSALAKETKDSTILIVAQRISTVMKADQIVVLDKGKVVGIGNHHQLMKNCEVYKQISLSQLSKEELAYEE